jgi:tetratricopeptide (TPR) repeat protein
LWKKWLTSICSSFIGFCCLKNISRFSHIFWIDASSEDAITLGLKGLCFHPDFKVAASLNSVSSQSALAWISSLQSNWLLVFDNADGGPEVVQKFIPSGSKGNILVTSRNKSLSLSQHRVRLMSHPMFKGASQYNHTVYETWDLSLCEIESRARRKTSSQDGNAAHAAILILQTAAFFHHENILEAIFRKASTSFCLKCHKKLDKKVIKSITELLQLGEDQFWNETFFYEGIRVLRSFSLIKEGLSSGIYTVHPLMHKWNRDRMPMSEMQVMHKVAKLILVHAIPLSNASKDFAFRRLLLVHIKTNYQFQQKNHFKKEFDELEYVRFSQVLQENGMWKDAEELRYQVMKIRKKRFGEMHQLTLTSMADLASTFMKQGNFEEAESLLIQVLNLYTKLLGPEHPDTLANMNNLALTFSDQGKIEEAEKLNMQVLNLCTKLLGPEHPDTLTSMNNFASSFGMQGKSEEAEKLQMKVFSLCRKLLGLEHPDTLITMSNLASTFSDQGKIEEAERLDMEVLNLRTKLLGPEHPDTLTSMSNLALFFLNQGKLEKAEKLEIQVLNLHTKLLGPEHPYTLTSMNDLALIFSYQGKFQEAEKLDMQILSLGTKFQGPEHPETLTSMNNLATTFLSQGKFEAAEK